MPSSAKPDKSCQVAISYPIKGEPASRLHVTNPHDSPDITESSPKASNLGSIQSPAPPRVLPESSIVGPQAQERRGITGVGYGGGPRQINPVAVNVQQHSFTLHRWLSVTPGQNTNPSPYAIPFSEVLYARETERPSELDSD